MAEKPSLLDWLGASVSGAYWQLGLGFMGWQTVAAPMRKGILEPLERALNATYRFENATAHQVCTLWERGLISTKDVITYLKNLGYDDVAISIITHYYALRIYDRIVSARIDKLKLDRDLLEEALYMKVQKRKWARKELLAYQEEIDKIRGWSLSDIMKRIAVIDKEIWELEHTLVPELWERITRGLPKIEIYWYGIKEFLKARPEEIPAVKPPAVPPPAVPEEVAPPVPKPPEVPAAAWEFIVKPTREEVEDFFRELEKRKVELDSLIKSVIRARILARKFKNATVAHHGWRLKITWDSEKRAYIIRVWKR